MIAWARSSSRSEVRTFARPIVEGADALELFFLIVSSRVRGRTGFDVLSA
jgi:hypothetical protein